MPNIAGASGANYFDVGVFNALVPKEGPKALPIQFPFSASISSLQADLTLTQRAQYISIVQGAYLDNSLNADAFTLQCPRTGQSITIPPYTQGYLPLLVSNPAQFTGSSSGEVTVTVIFYNIPVPAILWNVQSSGGSSGSFIELE